MLAQIEDILLPLLARQYSQEDLVPYHYHEFDTRRQ